MIHVKAEQHMEERGAKTLIARDRVPALPASAAEPGCPRGTAEAAFQHRQLKSDSQLCGISDSPACAGGISTATPFCNVPWDPSVAGCCRESRHRNIIVSIVIIIIRTPLQLAVAAQRNHPELLW